MNALEAMARAICRACGEDPDALGYHDIGAPAWDAFVPLARAALLALRDCSLYLGPMNAMRVAQQASYETWEAQMHATVTAMIDAILEEQ